MATKTYTIMHDDLDGTAESDTNPVSTVEFALDGQDYEIDLGGGNAANLRSMLAPFVAAARKATAKTATTAAKATRGTATAKPDREQNAAIRTWARSRGATISERGRIPAEVTEAYHKGGEAAEQALQVYIAGQQARLNAQLTQGANGQTAQVPVAAGV